MSKKNNEAREEEAKDNAARISETGKDIKKGMDVYEARFTSLREGEATAPPAGDSTRSEE